MLFQSMAARELPALPFDPSELDPRYDALPSRFTSMAQPLERRLTKYSTSALSNGMLVSSAT
jgi:hypothetical protein